MILLNFLVLEEEGFHVETEEEIFHLPNPSTTRKGMRVLRDRTYQYSVVQ
jgi:hypothetical protein